MKFGHLFSVDPLRPLEELTAASTVGVQAELGRRRHRLRGCEQVGGGQQVVQRLDGVPGPDVADGHDPGAEHVEQRADAPHVAGRAAGHDREAAADRPGDAAGDRRVHQRDAGPAGSAASSLVTAGSEELMSTITVPRARIGSRLSRTRRTTAESGSMRMTAAAPAAEAARVAAGLAPTRSAQFLAASCWTSYPWTR